MRWPNFFIVGTVKGGTTALSHYLEQHPDIYVSPLKEPHFFSQARDKFSQTVTDEGRYLELFSAARHHRAVGEASTSYLWSPIAAQCIYEKVPDAQIIALLRDPVDRAHSHYLMDVRNGLQKLPFHEAISDDRARQPKRWGVAHLYVELGLYHDQLRRYLDLFGPERVLVLTSDELRQQPLDSLRKVWTHLGVHPPQAQGIDYCTPHNPFGIPRNQLAELIMKSRAVRKVSRALFPKRVRERVRDRVLLSEAPKPALDPDTKDLLISVYRPEVDSVEALLDRRLPELRRTWRT